MSSENKITEPMTDLELGSNYPNQCIWKNLNNDSGAGANAASQLDMTFVASDSLSELVWSPDKGLSLKCADSSFADKNASHFWDVGPSNMVLAPPQGVIGGNSATDKPVAAVCLKTDIDGMDTPTRHPTIDSCVKPECKAYEEQELGKGSSGDMEEINTEDKVFDLHSDQKENAMISWEKKICSEDNTGTAQISQIKGNKSSTISGQVDKRLFDVLLLQEDELKPSMEQNPLPRDHTSVGRETDIGNHAIERDNDLCAKVEPVTKYKALGAPGTNLTSCGRSPIEKLESTAENDLQTFNCEAACGATGGVLVLKSKETEKKSQDNEMRLLCDKNLPVMRSPSNSKTQMISNKGKEKALSDGNVRLSKEEEEEEEEDDSHESVESCNSTGLFSVGKKRWNFQQQLIVRSNRVKKQVQETSDSKYFVKQDSSFMNWISNMMKGFSQSIQDEANPSSPTLAHTNHGDQLPDPKFVTYCKNHDPEPKDTGFQSIFQSIYCPSLKPVGTRMSSANQQVRDNSEDFELGNKVHGIDATPITCCAENDSLYEQNIPSDEFERSTWGYDAGTSTQPKVEPINFVNSQESSKNELVENKNCSNLVLSKEKEGMTSNSSSGRQNTNNTENIDAYALSEKKENNICHRSDTLQSLWITRFSPKSTASLIISDHLNQAGRTQVHSTDRSKSPHTPKHKFEIEDAREESGDVRLLTEAKESLNCSTSEKASTDAENNKGNDYHKSIHNFNPISPSPRVSNSEPMTSVFVRRLDAIKYVKPSNRTVSTTHTNMTCLFCGTRGHQLHDCSEITESELEHLLKNINSYGEVEELPCLCIKCFQPDHWAILCPTSIPIGQHDLKIDALVNDCSPSGINFDAGKEETARPLTGEENHPLTSGAINDGIGPQAEGNLNLKRKSNEIITSENIGSNAPIKKLCGSSSEENKLKESPMTSPCGFIGRQISDETKRIFDAVRKLRLSRTEILKWINSHMSISNLDGFLLRLRLRKWEEGLGGTGYYVGSINEAQRQSSQQSIGKSISVNVGGIKCMVQSQYISNHDFLEEEIMAWWSTTSKAGSNIPTEEDLIEKIKKKKMLGF